MERFTDLDPACKDANGWFRIVGFGSLLAKSSAERSFPRLREFRVARLPMAVRVFGHAAPVFFERKIAMPEAPFEFSSTCGEPGFCETGSSRIMPQAEPSLGTKVQFDIPFENAKSALDSGRFMFVTCFYIPPEDMAAFRHRELEFTYISVKVYGKEDSVVDGIPGLMCGRGSDDLVRERQDYSPEKWQSTVTAFGIDSIWDYRGGQIFPCRPYLRLCVLGSEMLGDEVKQNFLDTSFLADRKTSIREHLAANPDIMETLPPEHVRKFYTP